MAQSLSQTLTLTRLSPLSTTRLITSRRRSSLPEKFSGADTAKVPEEVSEIERNAFKKLEDVVHRMIVKKAEPNWLPLVPGGSYWVPPKSKTRGFAQVIGKLASNSNGSMKSKDKGLSLSSNRGWPSSAHFFKGACHPLMEGETTLQPSHSKDEEK